MQSVPDIGHERPVAPSDPPAGRWRWRLTTGLVTSLAAVGLVTASATAASAAPLPPAAGVSPAVVAGGTTPTYFYTAANGTVWAKTETGTATQVSSGIRWSAEVSEPCMPIRADSRGSAAVATTAQVPLAAAMTLLVAPLTLTAAMASVAVSAVFVLGPATQLAVWRWRYLHFG